MIFYVVAILTFVASCYVSQACFCIIHRMTRATPWSLAIPIIAISALGAFGLIEALACIVGKSSHVHPLLAFSTVIAAIIFRHFPRVDISRRARHERI